MQENIDIYLEKLPDSSRALATSLWSSVPSDMRRELNLTLGAFGKITQHNPMAAADLVTLIKRQAAPALQPLSSIAVVGPANVGKSTLFNALLKGTGFVAEVSPIPGTTTVAQSASVGLFSMVDTPGQDSGRSQGQQEKQAAQAAAQNADFLIIVFDVSGITPERRAMYQEMLALGKPHLIALNKIDLIPSKQLEAVVQSAAEVLGVSPEMIHAISAVHHRGIENLLLEAAATEPRLLGEMGKVLVPLRRKLAWQAIRRTSVAACVISLTPLPIVDIVPLTVLQASMVVTLARIYDKPITSARACELLASFGMGLGARALFQQLSKLGGPPGWALSASIAGATSMAIGWTIIRWFETGIKPDFAALQSVSASLQKELFEKVKSLRQKKRPSKAALTTDLENCMPNISEQLENKDNNEQTAAPNAVTSQPPAPTAEVISTNKEG